MPLLLSIPVGLLFGVALAWIARAELARYESPLLLARPFVVALGFGLLVFGPVVGAFVALHGDWAYLYFVRWSRVPSALDLALAAFAGLQVPLGFAAAAPWAIAKRGNRLARVAAVLGVLLVAAGVVFARRLGVSASYAQYHGGFGAVPLGKSPLGRAILLSWLALAIAVSWTVHVLRSPRRR